MTPREELEAAKAAALAEVAAIDAKIAALDEPDWELFGTLLAAAKGRYAPDMVKLADFVVRHAHAFAAAPLMPTAAMTDAEIEELAREIDGAHEWDGLSTRDYAEHAIRATIARLGHGRKAWPSEAELRKMVQSAAYPPGRDRGPCEAALEMARRLREFGA